MNQAGSGADRDSSPAGEFPRFLQQPEDRLQQLIRGRIESLSPPSLGNAVEDATSGGKRLRPLLALWFGSVLQATPKAVEPIACLTEWLHSAFLILDDIQDGDHWRRDRPALWKSHGVATALNAADWLLATVYEEVGRVEVDEDRRALLLRSVQDVHRRTVVGQQFDLDGRADPNFNLSRYEQAVQAKTGRYLALGMVAVAIVAGFEQDTIDSLWRVGDQLGPAFQIQDDLLDLTTSKGRAGEIGNDIREGKPSILYAHALEAGDLSDENCDRLVAVMAKERSETSEQEVNWVIDLFDRCGSIEFARHQARSRAQEGVRLFGETAGVSNEACHQFESFARFAVERNR